MQHPDTKRRHSLAPHLGLSFTRANSANRVVPVTTLGYPTDDPNANTRRKSIAQNLREGTSHLRISSQDIPIFRDLRSASQMETHVTVDISKYRGVFHFVVSKTTTSRAFNVVIVGTILVNMITIALETLPAFQNKSAETTFSTMSLIYLSIYTMEFLFKIFAEPVKYWQNNYNRMDFIVLAISYVTDVALDSNDTKANVSFLKIFRALRALRALRSISFIRPLQVLVSALIKTMASILYLVGLLLLLMFVWAMIGHYSFGRTPDADSEEWGTIQFSMYQLWVLVTLDSWTDIQYKLLDRNFSEGSVAAFIIPWIFVGNFIFTNLFIGVVVQNLEEAQAEEKTLRDQKRAELFKKKKEFILEKQRRDLEQIMKSQEKNGRVSLDDFLKNLAGTLDHDDVAPIKTLCCSRMWFETYMESLQFYEEAKQRVHRLHLRTATKLNEVLERRMTAMLTQH